jgi:hypothetical protein
MNLRTTTARTLAVAALATGAIAGMTGAANAAATVESGPWPIVDTSGVTRSHLNINPAIACYAQGSEVVRIEGRYESGDSVYRIVPQFGCNVLPDRVGTADLVEVRGLVGGFANPWHAAR